MSPPQGGMKNGCIVSPTFTRPKKGGGGNHLIPETVPLMLINFTASEN